MANPYERTDALARFYDTIYDKVRGADRGTISKKLFKLGGPVLEIGVGTGRIFCGALKKGVDIFGIDVSPAMLEKLKEKIPAEDHHRVTLQNVSAMDLGENFDLIIAPFRVFSHLINVEDQLSALDGIHRHLQPGGQFIFDVHVPNLRFLIEGMTDKLDFEGEHAPGKKLQGFSTT